MIKYNIFRIKSEIFFNKCFNKKLLKRFSHRNYFIQHNWSFIKL
jgi:hypothetical protein